MVCIIGNKALAVELKEKLTAFLNQTLKFELNQEKTAITNLANSRVRFLGCELTKAKCNTKLAKAKRGHKCRSLNGRVELLVSGQVIRDKFKSSNGASNPVPADPESSNQSRDLESYNAEVRGLCVYYCLATDVGEKLGYFKCFHYGSMFKTIVCKMRTSTNAIVWSRGVLVSRKRGQVLSGLWVWNMRPVWVGGFWRILTKVWFE